MSVATNCMTHFNSAADGYIDIEVKARGLADELFLGLRALAEELDKDSDLQTEFSKVLIDVESARKSKVIEITGDKTMTLSKFSSSYKVRKSELNKGLTNGVDPTKYDSFSAYRKAIDKKTGGNSVGSNGGINNGGKGKGSGAPNGSESSGSSPKLHSVTSELSDKVRDKVNLLAKHLVGINEADALKVLQDCDGRIHALAKAQARFGGAKTKTA